jgi:hypothetical protein
MSLLYRTPTSNVSTKFWRRTSIAPIPTNHSSIARHSSAEPVKIRNLKEEDVKIRILGDFAIIHGRTSYITPDGQQAYGRYTDCWAKQNGKWLAVSAHVAR